jgi:hypothetical protein
LSAGSGRSSNCPVNALSKFPLTRENLAKLRLKAVRRGCWFRDLEQNERMLLDLTIRVVERVHSFMLAKVVSRLVSRLCEAMESRIFRLIRTEGRSMAEGLSEIAQSWGYRAAKSWADDCGFMQYLVVSNFASLKTWV